MHNASLLVTALALLIGCGEPDDTSPDGLTLPEGHTGTTADTDTTDTDTTTTASTETADTATGTTTTPTLNGEVPAVALPVPTFTEVLAMDGTSRSSTDLVGQPTVLWFYPAAGTGG
jgi:hypothetical protein